MPAQLGQLSTEHGGHRLLQNHQHGYGICKSTHRGLRLDFTSKLVHVLAFGIPKFYIAPYDKIKHELVNLSSNCDVKSGLSVLK